MLDVTTQGLVGDGVTDNAVALAALLLKIRGKQSSVAFNGAQGLLWPAGVYLTSQPLHLGGRHSGVIMLGEGGQNSVIQYAGSGFLLLHYEATDGQLQNPCFRDMGFLGPGPGSAAGILHSTSKAGSWGWSFERCRFTGFGRGNLLDTLTTPGAGDTNRWTHCIFKDVSNIFEARNPQSVNNAFENCVVIMPTAGGDVFRVLAGGQLVVSGGTYDLFGSGALLHFLPGLTLGPTNNQCVFRDLKLESHGTVILADDDPLGFKKKVILAGINAATVTGPARSMLNLRDGCQVSWRGGTLSGGVTLAQLNPPGGQGPPYLLLDNVEWLNSAGFGLPTRIVNQPL